MLWQLMLMPTLVAMVTGSLCPPPCKPPAIISGCAAFKTSTHCSQDLVDISVSQAVCSCMWQQFIEAEEPEAVVTESGEQCYTWATVTCTLEQTESNKITAEISRDIAARVNSLQKAILDRQKTLTHSSVKEVAKHRKRNGVEFKDKIIAKEEGIAMVLDELSSMMKTKSRQKINDNKQKPAGNSDVDFVGKPEKSGSLTWVEVEPVKENSSSHVLPVTHKWYWFLWNVQDDKFKLWVFLGICMLNVIMVLVAIFCRSDQKAEPREVRALGDLDPDMYIKNKDHKKQTALGNFLRKIREFKDNKAGYAQLENRGSGPGAPRGYGSQQAEDGAYEQHRRQSRGIYDDLVDDSFGQVYDYEVPVHAPRDYFSPKPYSYDTSMQTDSATKEQPRTVSFSLPQSGQESGPSNRRPPNRPDIPPDLSMGKYFSR